MNSETDQDVMDAAAKVLRAGMWLLRNGYGKMMVLPYAGATGAWRCEFHPIGRPSKTLFRYTTASEAKYLDNHCGGTIQRNVSPKKLAQAIMKSVSNEIKTTCEGEATPETLLWLERLDAVLDAGFVPQAFHEYTEDYSQWELVSLTRGNGAPITPQPGYFKPGTQRSIVDIEWSAGEAAWAAIAGSQRVSVNLITLTDDERCYDLAERLRRAFGEAEDGFDAMRLLRSAVGSLTR